MFKTPVKARKDAYFRQSGRCYYCQQPMWLDDHGPFVNQYGLTEKESARFQCTAEHLKARQDGGRDDASNIVAACAFCNRARHRRPKALEPEPYKHFVHRLQSRGHWHSPKLLSKLATRVNDGHQDP